MIPNRPVIVSQEEADNFNRGSHQAARRAQELNPVRISPRSVQTIRGDIDALIGTGDKHAKDAEGILPRFRRNLEQARERKEDRLRLIQALEARKATLEADRDVPESVRRSELSKIVGYSFKDKYDVRHHMPGSLELIREEVKELDRQIAKLEKSVENVEERIRIELPKLEAELKAARHVDKLVG